MDENGRVEDEDENGRVEDEDEDEHGRVEHEDEDENGRIEHETENGIGIGHGISARERSGSLRRRGPPWERTDRSPRIADGIEPPKLRSEALTLPSVEIGSLRAG